MDNYSVESKYNILSNPLREVSIWYYVLFTFCLIRYTVSICWLENSLKTVSQFLSDIYHFCNKRQVLKGPTQPANLVCTCWISSEKCFPHVCLLCHFFFPIVFIFFRGMYKRIFIQTNSWPNPLLQTSMQPFWTSVTYRIWSRITLAHLWCNFLTIRWPLSVWHSHIFQKTEGSAEG